MATVIEKLVQVMRTKLQALAGRVLGPAVRVGELQLDNDAQLTLTARERAWEGSQGPYSGSGMARAQLQVIEGGLIGEGVSRARPMGEPGLARPDGNRPRLGRTG